MKKYESKNYFISNVYGIGSSIIKQKDETMPDFQLHFLFSYGKEIDTLYILCLEHGTIFPIEKFLERTDKEKQEEIDKSMKEATESFIVQVYQNVIADGKLRDKTLFSKWEPKYWKAYNSIEQKSFINDINNLKSKVKEDFLELKKSEEILTVDMDIFSVSDKLPVTIKDRKLILLKNA